MQPIQWDENDRVLDIRYDFVFKAIFTRETPASRGALSSLVSALIGKAVAVESIAANEPPVRDARDRQIRFDISCKAAAGELVNIEMTFHPKEEELARLEFFMARLFARQDMRGADKSYSDLKETFQIAILGSQRFFPDGQLVHRFRYYDEKNNMPFNGKGWIVIMELAKAGQFLDRPAEELGASEAWGLFFEYLTDAGKRPIINEILKQEEGIAMASEELASISQDDAEWARLESQLKWVLDNNSDKTLLARATKKAQELETEIAGKETEIAGKDAEIAGKDAEIAGKDAIIVKMEEENASKDGVIAKMEEENASRDAEIQRLLSEMQKLRES